MKRDERKAETEGESSANFINMARDWQVLCGSSGAYPRSNVKPGTILLVAKPPLVPSTTSHHFIVASIFLQTFMQSNMFDLQFGADRSCVTLYQLRRQGLGPYNIPFFKHPGKIRRSQLSCPNVAIDLKKARFSCANNYQEYQSRREGKRGRRRRKDTSLCEYYLSPPIWRIHKVLTDNNHTPTTRRKREEISNANVQLSGPR